MWLDAFLQPLKVQALLQGSEGHAVFGVDKGSRWRGMHSWLGEGSSPTFTTILQVPAASQQRRVAQGHGAAHMGGGVPCSPPICRFQGHGAAQGPFLLYCGLGFGSSLPFPPKSSTSSEVISPAHSKAGLCCVTRNTTDRHLGSPLYCPAARDFDPLSHCSPRLTFFKGEKPSPQ